MTHLKTFAVFATSFCLSCSPAFATWSIILCDTRTGELAVGSASCVTNTNLKTYLPVVRPTIGVAVAQGMVDATGANRLTIWNELANGTGPDDILQILAAQDPDHESRQYAIVDVRGRIAAFTGSANEQLAGELTGRYGTIVYGIVGNGMAGDCALLPVEAAIINTPGGLPEKLMAAMEAARSMGGDGHCSCNDESPTACGCPPPAFAKSAHVGFMIDAQFDWGIGSCDNWDGCATGLYFMNFNISDGSADALDPVLQLRAQFDTWRAHLVGVPDGTASLSFSSRGTLPNDGVSPAIVTVVLRDYVGNPVNGVGVSVIHDLDSTHSSTVGWPVYLGNGISQVLVIAGPRVGVDRLHCIAIFNGGVFPIIPEIVIRIVDPRTDLNGDGLIDLADLSVLLANFGQSAVPGDIDGNGIVDLSDLALLLEAYGSQLS